MHQNLNEPDHDCAEQPTFLRGSKLKSRASFLMVLQFANCNFDKGLSNLSDMLLCLCPGGQLFFEAHIAGKIPFADQSLNRGREAEVEWLGRRVEYHTKTYALAVEEKAPLFNFKRALDDA